MSCHSQTSALVRSPDTVAGTTGHTTEGAASEGLLKPAMPRLADRPRWLSDLPAGVEGLEPPCDRFGDDCLSRLATPLDLLAQGSYCTAKFGGERGAVNSHVGEAFHISCVGPTTAHRPMRQELLVSSPSPQLPWPQQLPSATGLELLQCVPSPGHDFHHRTSSVTLRTGAPVR